MLSTLTNQLQRGAWRAKHIYLFSFDNLGLDKVGNAWPPKGGVKTREMRGFVWIVSVGMYEL